MNTSECKKVLLYYCLYYTSDWLKHQIFPGSMYINPLFSKQLPHNKISSN